MSSSADHIYLDLGVVNNDNNGSQIKRNLQFSENRSSSVLDNPSNYEMSVVRFQMDTPNYSLPVFVPLLNVDGTNGLPKILHRLRRPMEVHLLRLSLQQMLLMLLLLQVL